MKQLKEKSRLRQIRRNKKRLPKELKRKAKRKELAMSMEKIRVSGRRLQKLQKQYFAERMRILKNESSNTE
tara:strand:- start:91 stop:303 length:213 start_codon:yes stop_codon:yes gene_type:complete